jgi:pimeloyl-ACP methyl ester carboxylesterase
MVVAISASDQAREKKYKPLVVRAPDGVTLAAQEWGNPAGSEILFIHGFSQASLSWQRQVESDLAKEFRLVTYDLRGHGNSDKPLEPEKYKESEMTSRRSSTPPISSVRCWSAGLMGGMSLPIISGFTAPRASRVSTTSTQ